MVARIEVELRDDSGEWHTLVYPKPGWKLGSIEIENKYNEYGRRGGPLWKEKTGSFLHIEQLAPSEEFLVTGISFVTHIYNLDEVKATFIRENDNA